MKKKPHVYKQGEYAYFVGKGEIVRIIGSTKSKGFLKTTTFRVLSLKDIDPFSDQPTMYYECNQYALAPILDPNIQFLIRMAYKDQKFTIIRQLS